MKKAGQSGAFVLKVYGLIRVKGRLQGWLIRTLSL